MHSLRLRQLVLGLNQIHYLIVLPALLQELLEEQELLPLEPLGYHVALIVSLMPASCTSVLIVRKYGGCPDFAGQSVFFSTIACIVTVPVFLYFLM